MNKAALRRGLDVLDRYQRGHRWLGFPLAVVYKFIDDQGSYLASLIAYYGFLSLFPLLLVLTTVLGFVLDGHPGLQHQLLGTVLGQFPVLGARLTDTARPLHGSGTGLWVGLVVALYGGLGFAVAIQNAFNQAWAVPMHARPDPVATRLRGLGLLGVLGAGVVLTSGLSFATSIAEPLGSRLAVVVPVAALTVSVLINGGLFVLGFRVLTARALATAEVLPGAVAGALGWQLLQSGGPIVISHQLAHSDQIYGLFGLVLVLLAWIYLQGLVIVLAAQINVVRVRRLWPRALLSLTPLPTDDELTAGDRRSYQGYARAQRYKKFEQITVEFSGESSQPPHLSESSDSDPEK